MIPTSIARTPSCIRGLRVMPWHRQLVGLGSRWSTIRTACPWLRRSGDAGDLGPNLKGSGPSCLILGGWDLVSAEQEEVVDPGGVVAVIDGLRPMMRGQCVRTDRAKRSSLGTTSVSPVRTAARAWSSPGRDRFVPVNP